jgi:hypothetical protein
VLVTKARRAAAAGGATGIVLGGGVAANSLLREEILGACAADGIQGFLPSRAMCTDNAAMIAATGWHRLRSTAPPPRHRRPPQPPPPLPRLTPRPSTGRRYASGQTQPRCVTDTVGRDDGVAPRIGGFEPSAPVVLAPMAGVTNAPFRAVCRKFAPDLVYVNEMVMATAVVHRNDKTRSDDGVRARRVTRSLQLYGSDPEMLGRAVASCATRAASTTSTSTSGAPPQRSPGGRRCGRAGSTRTCCERSCEPPWGARPYGVPVTAKFRMGLFDDLLTHRRTGEIAPRRASPGSRSTPAPCSSTTPVRRGGRRSPSSSRLWLDPGARQRRHLGGVRRRRMMAATGCDGVVIGRGCLGRPWLFADLVEALAGSTGPGEPSTRRGHVR